MADYAYRCTCEDGYDQFGDGKEMECKAFSCPCDDHNAICTVVDNIHQCLCESGYVQIYGDPNDSRFVVCGECRTAADDCDGKKECDVNNKCVCPDGLLDNGGSCEECTTGSNNCGGKKICDASFNCVCTGKLIENDSGDCVECTTVSNNCGENKRCDRSFKCVCADELIENDSGGCVECLADGDCTRDTTKSKCDTDTCVECLADGDCTFDATKSKCDTDTCVECTSASNNCGEKKVCDASYKCVCDGELVGNDSGDCVECTSTSNNCGENKGCDASFNCVCDGELVENDSGTCVVDHECSDTTTCDGSNTDCILTGIQNTCQCRPDFIPATDYGIDLYCEECNGIHPCIGDNVACEMYCGKNTCVCNTEYTPNKVSVRNSLSCIPGCTSTAECGAYEACIIDSCLPECAVNMIGEYQISGGGSFTIFTQNGEFVDTDCWKYYIDDPITCSGIDSFGDEFEFRFDGQTYSLYLSLYGEFFKF